ncbi:MAG: XRE family transcriptional regulator [Actinomycetota bacterium]
MNTSAGANDSTDATEMVAVVGANIRRLRERAGWSLGELARRSDVGKSTLSQLEAGQGNPGVETLVSITAAFGIPFGELVVEARPEIDVLAAGEGPLIESSDRTFRARLLQSTGRRGVAELYEYSLRAGAVYEAEPHPRGVVETAVCLTGRVRVGPPPGVELGPGDRATFPADQAHAYEALDGDATLVGLLDYP